MFDGGWVETKDLQPGQLLHSSSGAAVEVVAVHRTNRSEPTYNFEIADFHTYFVGEAGAWVHNACDPNILKQAIQFIANKGISAGKLNGEILKWGTKAAGAEARLGQINAATVAQMRAQGLTQGMVRALRSGYVDAVARGTGFGTAEARIPVLNAILGAW